MAAWQSINKRSRKRQGDMRERQRAEIVRNLLAERGFLSISDIMAATGVSAASARRDAARLAEAGVAERLHGGVQALEGASSKATAPATLAADVAALDAFVRAQQAHSRNVVLVTVRAIERRLLGPAQRRAHREDARDAGTPHSPAGRRCRSRRRRSDSSTTSARACAAPSRQSTSTQPVLARACQAHACGSCAAVPCPRS